MLKQHFSHRHPLCAAEVAEDDRAVCSGCDHHLSGSAYSCIKPKCDFHLHDLCFALPPEIHHVSHPKHPLILVAAPPYADGEFACNACGDFGSSFMYHCPRCQFDLHIHCATLPETLTRNDHSHPLRLFHSVPNTEKGSKLGCRVCEGGLGHGYWAYYCRLCDYGVHVDCVVAEEDDEEEEIV